MAELWNQTGASGLFDKMMSVANVTEMQDVDDTDLEKEEYIPAWERPLMLSDEQRVLAETIQRPMQYVFVVISVPLAIINIIVFSRKEMRSPSAIYVISLNAGQMFYVLSTTVDDLWRPFVDPPYSQLAYSAFVYHISFYGGVFVAKRGSYAILVPASLERLYAVLRPLHLKNFFLSKRAGVVVVCIYALSAILHIYFLTKVQVSPVKNADGVITYVAVWTALYNQPGMKAVNDFFSLAAKFLLTYTSLGLQLILNLLTVWALRRHNSKNKNVQSSADDAKRLQERQLTITLLGASASYLIFSLPAALFNVFNNVYSDFLPSGRYYNLYYVMSGFCYNMTVLGCGVDFFAYVFLSSKYRRTLFKMFGCSKFLSNSSQGKTESQTEISAISETKNTSY